MVFSVVVLTTGGVLANGVTSFAINWDVIAGGDGTASSANYNVTGTIGQPLTATTYYGAARQLTAGYCYPAAPPGRCLDPQAVFTLDKQVDKAIAGVGEHITYIFIITNQSTDNITYRSLYDTLFPDLDDLLINELFERPSFPVPRDIGKNGEWTITLDYTVQPDDPSALVNTVTVRYEQLGTIYSASDNCTVSIIKPSVSVTKTGSFYAMAGDNVSYAINVANTGNVDLDLGNITDTVSDNITGDFPGTLLRGDSFSNSYTYVVQSDDTDPWVNQVTAQYHAQGYPQYNTSALDIWSVNLIEPSISVTKTAPPARAGDEIDCTIAVTNTGDIPLVSDNITDSTQGDITGDFLGYLNVGATDSVTYYNTHTVQNDDPDPLELNVVTAQYHPFHPEVSHHNVTGQATLSVDLIPTVNSVTPSRGYRGTGLSVTINGYHLNRATAVSFGSGITVDSFTADSATQITADITIAANAALGTRDVSVTSPGGIGTLNDGFNVYRSGQSVATATGTGVATFGTSSGSITGLTAIAQATLTCPATPGLTFPHGLFSFNITNIPPGSTVTITITLPSAVPAGTQYRKCQNGAWVDVTSLLGDNDGDNVLTLTLTDGGLGDADGTAKGTIVDPGGPAVVAGTGAATGGKPAPMRLTPPDLKEKYLSVNPRQAHPDQPVTILTNVVNEGGMEGSYTVNLVINGQLEQTKTVIVGPGATQPVKFTISKAQPGTYTVAIGGNRARFSVIGADGVGSVGLGSGLVLAVATFVLVVLAGLLLLVVRKRFQAG